MKKYKQNENLLFAHAAANFIPAITGKHADLITITVGLEELNEIAIILNDQLQDSDSLWEIQNDPT